MHIAQALGRHLSYPIMLCNIRQIFSALHTIYTCKYHEFMGFFFHTVPIDFASLTALLDYVCFFYSCLTFSIQFEYLSPCR